MSEEEKNARIKEAKVEAAAICKILEKRKDMISGDEDDLTLASKARELSGTLADLATVLKVVETPLSKTSLLLMRYALEATTTADSAARRWFKSTISPWTEKNALTSAVFEAVASGLVKKYAEAKSLDWFRRLLEVRLEKGESPKELLERIKMFNINSGNKMESPQLREVLLEAIKRGDNDPALMLSESSKLTNIDEVAEAAEKVWERRDKGVMIYHKPVQADHS